MTNDPFKEARDFFQALRGAYQEVENHWRSQVEQFGEAARKVIAEADKGWTQAMLDTAEGLEKLAGHGWYLSSSVGWDVPVELGRDDEIDCSQIDGEMCKLWKQELPAVEKTLGQDHRQRAPVLHQAFEAHRNGQYFLSVLAFLSQADGICHDLVDVQLYAKVDGGNATKVSKAKTADDRMRTAYLAPLATVQPITWGPAKRASEPGHLNRHAVFHGEDVEYGNEINSLKALSLLSYASWALTMAKSLDPSDDER